MNRIIIYLSLIISISVCSCSEYDDVALWNRTQDIDDRLIAVEETCKQLNNNVEGLQIIINSLQIGDYITDVSPVINNGKEIGFAITFNKAGSITIYHGNDGKDGINGENGSDGNTPVIAVALDSDGIYYWTINGEWMLTTSGDKVQAQGINGTNGANGTPGADGKPGQNGQDGKDGITPKFKIENGFWMLSYNDGATWDNLGKATGEDGKDGNGGDSFFKDVDSSNPDYLIFTLSNDIQIKVPTWKAFEALRIKCDELNTNIISIQAILNALQERDYIKNVIPLISNGKEIGYSIVFGKSPSISIYHGKDGNNGESGSIPQIGVKKDLDNIYYWTLNDDWLTDSDGNKIIAQGQDGKDGIDGAPGQDGADGTDGITPQIKIENGNWMMSMDNGNSWTTLGKATGEDGKDGENGSDGDSMFSGVDYTSDPDYVIFKLSNGDSIKLPTWQAFETLRIMCNKMNTNITSLKSIIEALEDCDYIKSITPVMENGLEIGYTITFAKSNPITIYHGKNGSDGIDGTSPSIGVKQDSDNIYYWTIDNKWLTDNNGNKIKAQGNDGEPGKDGTTPLLKIEGGNWFLSTDNGTSWNNLGPATGSDGKDGKDGDSIFKSVSQDITNVYFTLSDGTVITVPKGSNSSNISFSFSMNNITWPANNTITVGQYANYTINYTIQGTLPTDNVSVDFKYSGNWIVKLTKKTATTGTITVVASQASGSDPSAVITLFASINNSNTAMAIITANLKK